MACTPFQTKFGLRTPDGLLQAVLGLEKICGANDEATWKVSFEVQERADKVDPLDTVVSFAFDLDPKLFTKANETAENGLDDHQIEVAMKAANRVRVPDATDAYRRQWVQKIIDERKTSGTGPR